ncbi:hypothetical protein [Salinibacterium sp. SWN248]|uniref:hypothetical protein n=1 Tax=Salinibacterium sp. SWN248 TaxID=2792056 RepID=UPI0018CC8B0F|nr:hypothetical protein [Salinibacterium sp. SWN248]MBH0024749.1 hypothetical protein [Salinibacterium sp. SWN248]
MSSIMISTLPWPVFTLIVIATAIFFAHQPTSGRWGGRYSIKRFIVLSLWSIVGVTFGSLWPQITMGTSIGNVIGYEQERTVLGTFAIYSPISFVAFAAAITLTILWAKPTVNPTVNPNP